MSIRSKVMAAGLMTGLLAVLAAPAQAKEPWKITGESMAMVGQGLREPISMSGRDAAMFAEHSRTFSKGKMTGRPPAVRLGPGYDVLYIVACDDGGGAKAISIEQTVFPYATFRGRGTPWTYTPAGQPFCFGDRTPAGWVAGARDLLPALVSLGLPATAPVIVPSERLVPVPQPGPGPWVVAVAMIGLFGAVAMLVTMATVIRRRGRVAA